MVAAYDLGLNARMLRYQLRYPELYPWHPKANGGRNVHDRLSWIGDDFAILIPDLVFDAPSGPLLRAAEEFRTRAAERREVGVDATRSQGVDVLRPCWASWRESPLPFCGPGLFSQGGTSSAAKSVFASRRDETPRPHPAKRRDGRVAPDSAHAVSTGGPFETFPSLEGSRDSRVCRRIPGGSSAVRPVQDSLDTPGRSQLGAWRSGSV